MVLRLFPCPLPLVVLRRFPSFQPLVVLRLFPCPLPLVVPRLFPIPPLCAPRRREMRKGAGSIFFEQCY